MKPPIGNCQCPDCAAARDLRRANRIERGVALFWWSYALAAAFLLWSLFNG